MAIVFGDIDYNKYRPVLIIAPHADDETIGCGGMIAKISKLDIPVEVVVFATPRRPMHSDRTLELTNAMEILNAQKFRVLYPEWEAFLDRKPMRPMITNMDHILAEVKPSEVYYNPSDHHQDHIVVEKVMRAAMRPWALAGHRPNLVAAYGITTLYIADTPKDGYIYVGFGEKELDKKMQAIHCYQSQLRGAGAVSPEIIALDARMRGLESGYKYAERFKMIMARR